MKSQKNYRYYYLIIGSISVFLVMGFLYLNQKTNQKPVQKSYHVGGGMVTEHKSAISGGEQTCSYSVTYQGKVIKLGHYSHQGTCGISQKVTVSNRMIAVISGAYIYIYDPKAERIITLDPYAIKSFEDFSKTHAIDLFADYTSKRFFLNGESWQVEYDNTTTSSTSDGPKKLVFTTADNGQTFAFDPLVQK